MGLRGAHHFINELEPSQYLEGVYTIQNAQKGVAKTGKPYLKAIIGDRTGRIPCRMWTITDPLFNSLQTSGFVWIEGHTQPYQGEVQLVLQGIRPAEDDEIDLENLLPRTKFDVETMFLELRTLLESLSHPAMAGLARAYLDDDKLMKAFKTSPAAVTMHHAYIGGLLEHTLQLCRLADRICPLYPRINRDIVLLGLFLHDMAKCYELRFDLGFSYSDEGLLLGHLVMGNLILQRKADEARIKYNADISPSALMVLHHIILSHHSLPEYGAAKVPSTPEAILVARLDELDAKTQMALDACRPDGASSDAAFTERLWALDTRLYRLDPLANGNVAAGNQ